MRRDKKSRSSFQGLSLNILIVSILLIALFSDSVASKDIDEKLPLIDEVGDFVIFHDNTLSPFHSLVEKETIIVDGKEYQVAKIHRTTITAYSSTVDQTNSEPFITASGAWVEDGIVAANFLPFNTKIRIPAYFGDKVFVVKDRMNRRYDNRVDIWCHTRGEANSFGIKYTDIEILEEVEKPL